jgi:hypothetical protein
MHVAIIAAIFLVIGALGAGTYVSYSNKKAEEQKTVVTTEVSGEIAMDTATNTPPVEPSGTRVPTPQPVAAQAKVAVVVNDVKLTDVQIAALEKKYSTTIAGGNYWYDVKTGAWGKIGGPTEGWLEANESIGGNMKANASGNSNTGIFINGRELHATDVKNINALFAAYGTAAIPGSYWVDASGNFGLTGQTVALGNLIQMMQGLKTSGGSSSYYKTNGSEYTGFGGGGGSSYYSSKTQYGPNAGTNSVYVDPDGSVEIYTAPKDY